MKQQVVWKEERERGISRMKGLLKFITCGSVDDGKVYINRTYII